jgi:hypothetical protein
MTIDEESVVLYGGEEVVEAVQNRTPCHPNKAAARSSRRESF